VSTCEDCKYWGFARIEISASIYKKHMHEELVSLLGRGVASMRGCCRRYPVASPLWTNAETTCGEFKDKTQCEGIGV
jgi:hypothetical protein